MKENLHTVKIIDIIVSESLSDIFIVTKYVSKDLKKVQKQDDIGFSEMHTITVLFKMLCALNFLHKANVMHRDIKPSNILID